ncbi:hypothetical protein GOEFS_057_00030 [Gordonia effusa NBRC 100432]|uniref:DUF2631 domain-containing protein n=1 Tax=Gordonia effusa NBRC 100432 TaxID=1077974 RepID=H0R0C6_9ACTN|nr:DUF2631 domain-containing protein [Gordonia effusa]GAB18527.1 hypothetical protein GOEFS_057_00030 [Gordonia effusa NBRC 100432]
MAETAVQEHDSHAPIDTGWKREPADAPSARFGWHGQGRKSFMAAGWFFVIALLAMMIGNHHGKIEDLYLIGFAVVLAFFLIKNSLPSRRRWQR